MKSIKMVFALCVGSMMLAGCGPSKALQSAEQYEKDACACKDAKCATDATTKYGERQKDVAASMKSDEAEAITKHATAASECVMKVSMAGVPGTPAMPAKH
jgi:hypothetical protein